MVAINVLVFLAGMLTYANANIAELTDDSFLAYAKDKDVLLVEFYAPWCSDCQRLAPEFDRAAGQLGARSADLAKVDCFGAGKGLCEMYGVRSWPQLKNFNRGTYTGDYTGLQTAEAMASYITTVENSVAPQDAAAASIPYAMAIPAARPAYNYPHPSTPVGPAPPVVGELSCAKCNIETPKGKISKHCSESVKKACVELKQREEAKKKYDDDDKKRSFTAHIASPLSLP